ncbi:hypothetical protein EDD27_8079 [Nonomuraea polychroma]|uniref:DUF4149 domain-containing protein n=1 Tax=Nonomuraea polychroma TaxID=46176 RepID=A0A438MHG5_9ACTN|nr:hypothetical protein [Nonomuraea polychroma]RVX45290.1 hypothetical protein EDD27_8079 [Nonomuraea polychroma]
MSTVTGLRRNDPTPAGPPPVVHAAAMLWLSAVALGAFEAALMVSRELLAGTSTPAGLLPGAGFRLAVFAGAVFLALRLRRGQNWARWTLAGTLGVFGTLSLVVEPARWLLEGGSIAEAAAGLDAMGWVFAASRILHVAAVLGAMALMFQPRANAYFGSA